MRAHVGKEEEEEEEEEEEKRNERTMYLKRGSPLWLQSIPVNIDQLKERDAQRQNDSLQRLTA
jgi:hypothetical protein